MLKTKEKMPEWLEFRVKKPQTTIVTIIIIITITIYRYYSYYYCYCYLPEWLRARCTHLTKWLTKWLTIWLAVNALLATLTLG